MTRVVMYTSRVCGYCHRARQLLQKKGVALEEIAVDQDPARRDEMVARSGRRTVPQIFVDDVHIGGCDDLYALDHAGGLDELLSRPHTLT